MNLFLNYAAVDGRINQALLCGNIEVAVYLCLENERWADALLLATRGSPELMTKAQAKYFQVSVELFFRPFQRTMLNINKFFVPPSYEIVGL